MRIHDYPRYAEVIPQHDVSRLPPHARELSELLHRSRDLSPVFPDERLSTREYGFSLGPEKPAGVYLLLELRPLGPGEIGRGRVFHEEALRHLVHPLVRTLCGQYTTDEQLKRVPVVEVAPGLRVLLPQYLQYRERPFFLFRRALSSLNGALLSFHFFSHLWNKKRGRARGHVPFRFYFQLIGSRSGEAQSFRAGSRPSFPTKKSAFLGVNSLHFSGSSSSWKIASTGQGSTQAPQSMHSSGCMKSWSSPSYMQSTGHASTQALSLTPMQGSAMMYAILNTSGYL